jgi:probable rRNA maturation factor
MAYDVSVDLAIRPDEPLDPSLLAALAERTLTMERAPAGSVSIVITDDETVQALNRAYRGLDEPTDVLSFGLGGLAKPLEDAPTEDFVLPAGAPLDIGEVVIAYPYASRQARAMGRPVRDEIALLVVHGVLHLLGYDHLAPAEEARMQARERAVLSAFDIAR